MARTAPGLDRTFWLRFGITLVAVLLIAGIALSALAGSPVVAARVLVIILPVTLAIVATCYLFLLVVVLVHELGHLVGGRLVGFHLRSLIVGPFELHLTEKGRFTRVGDWRRTGGFVRMLPQSTDRLSFRFALFVLAGPVVSISFAFAMLEWFRLTPVPNHMDSLSRVLVYESILILCWMAFGILPGTLVPFTSRGGNATDMKVVWTLWRSKVGRDRYIAILLLSREILAGLRARDWTSSYCDIATETEDGDAEEVRARLLAYYHGLDSGRTEYARAQLARAVKVAKDLRKKRGIQGDLALLESALGSALIDHDADAAEQKLGEIGHLGEAVEGYGFAIRAAVAALRGQRLDAEAELAKAEEHFRVVHARFGGNPAFEEERLSEIRRLIAG